MEDRSLEDMERNRNKKRKCPKINQLFKIEILIEIMKEDNEMKKRKENAPKSINCFRKENVPKSINYLR